MQHTHDIYTKDEEGKLVLVSSTTYEAVVQDEISEKEEQLLQIYNELQALKNNQ